MATLAVNDVTPRVQYTATSGQTDFEYDFPIFVDADLVVYLTPSGQAADDDANLLTLATDYTVSGAGTDSGGTVTLVSAASAGDVVTIARDIAAERTFDYQNSGDLLASTLNDELDKLVMIVQQLETEIRSRTFFLQRTTNLQDVSLTVPTPDAGKYWRWNSDASAMEFGELPASLDATEFSKVDNFTALRTLSGMVTDDIALALGKSSKGDGFQGLFRYISGASAGTYTDDAESILVPVGGDGSAAWLRIHPFTLSSADTRSGADTDAPVNAAGLIYATQKAATTSGTSTAYTATYGISALETGREYVLDFDQACGASPTLNLDSLGAKDIVYYNGFAVAEGAIQARRHRLVYDGTDFVLQDPHVITMDFSSYSGSDYDLQPGERVFFAPSSVTSLALRVATHEKSEYRVSALGGCANNASHSEMLVNGSSYSGAFRRLGHYWNDAPADAVMTPANTNGLSWAFGDSKKSELCVFVGPGRSEVFATGLIHGYDGTNLWGLQTYSYLNSASPATVDSLGPIQWPAAWSGTVFVERIS